MAGGMFAGHDECGGDTIDRNGKKYKLFYGMASNTAMKKHAGIAEYRLVYRIIILKLKYILKFILMFLDHQKVKRWKCLIKVQWKLLY